jgi:hypothetical protein
VGSRSASVTVTDNASNSPQSVSLSGTGVTGTVYFQDGFESGNFSQWNLGSSDSSGQRTVETSVVHSGADAASFANASGQYSYLYTSFVGGPQSQTFTKLSFRLSSTTSDSILAIGRNANGGNVWEADYDSRGGLSVYFWTSTGSLVSVATPNQSIIANTWYTVELQDTETTTGQGQVWLNGTVVGSVNANLSVTAPYARLMLFNGAPATFYFDDVVVASNYQ